MRTFQQLVSVRSETLQVVLVFRFLIVRTFGLQYPTIRRDGLNPLRGRSTWIFRLRRLPNDVAQVLVRELQTFGNGRGEKI
jgi:hypothetical protein